MSFYLGVLLEGLIGLVSDRMIWNPITGERDVSHSRMAKINEHAFFIGAGNFTFAGNVYHGLREILGDGPIDLEKILDYGKAFLRKVAGVYREMKPGVVNFLEENEIDIRYERSNCLIGGVSSGGVLYLINLGDGKEFTFELLTKPFTYVSIIDIESEEARKRFNGSMLEFMRAVAEESPAERRNSMREFLPAVLAFVSKNQEFVSLEGDLLLIEKGGAEICFEVTGH
jgi:hypothetical protein